MSAGGHHDPRRLDGRISRLLAGVRWTHVSGPYQALDLRFGVRTSDPVLGSFLQTLFHPFRGQGQLDDVLWLSGLERQRPSNRASAYIGAHRLTVTTRRPLVLAALLWALNQEVVRSTKGCLLLHASAAERDGTVVVLPGPSGSGKTTLCAALLRRGYRYITDETVALDIATGRVRPFPKALSLDRGSWPLFADLAPQATDEHRHYIQEQWHLTSEQLGGAPPVGPEIGQPRIVLRPRYQDGATTIATAVRPAEAIQLLAENSFNATDWGQAGLDACAATVQGCTTLGRITFGDLNEACDIIDHAVAQADATAERRRIP